MPMVKKLYSSLDIQNKKQTLLRALGANEKWHLYLTASSAESDFQVLFSTYKDYIQQTGRTHLLTLESEEKTILQPLQMLEAFGIHGKRLPITQLTKEILYEKIRPRTAMLSLSWASGLTGVIQPVWDIAQVCKEKEIKLHLNIESVIGKLYFQLGEIEADFFTFNGGIIAKEPFTPAFEDLSSDPMDALDRLQGRLDTAAEQIDHLCMETARLRDQWECGIKQQFPESQILFQNVHRLPHISVIDFPKVHAEALSYLLYQQGIHAQPVGLISLSFAFSFETSEAEIDHGIEIVISCAQKLQTYAAQLC
ncbi:MAG TPA: aminotransferase class V-fold PLP-dependent enzyme [Rhabdochlamydiaceae bacterium]|nr:aminotransferase class V-fold PLP-dependent enzyme [Rhabdochlamydiaceae bacterium]